MRAELQDASGKAFVSVGDGVKVVSGHHAGKEGTIKHIFAAFVFVHSRLM
jgi:ribosomal protein L24